MGLFDNIRDELSSSVEGENNTSLDAFDTDDFDKIAKNAKGDSIESELSNENDMISHVSDEKIPSLLRNKEQPHYVVNKSNYSIKIENKNSREVKSPNLTDYITIIVTNERLIYLEYSPRNFSKEFIYFNNITDYSVTSGMTKNKMEIETVDRIITFSENRTASIKEVNEISDFIESKIQSSNSLRNGGFSNENESPNYSSMSNQKLLTNLCNIDPYEFEYLISDLWTNLGWNTEVTTGSNDRGIDIIAKKTSPIEQKHLLQIKKNAPENTIGSPSIQQYSSLYQQENNVDSVVIITTSTFSEQAQKTAKDLNVKLINGNELCGLIQQNESFDIVEQFCE